MMMDDNGVPPSGSGHEASPSAASASSQSRVPNAGDYVRSLPWRDMASFPKDGEIVAAMYYPWNVKTNSPAIHFAQWIDLYGTGGEICSPWNPNDHPYAEGWLPLSELHSASAMSARSVETEGLDPKDASAVPQGDAHE